MTPITFSADCGLSALDRHSIISQFLKEHKLAVVTFTKIDGTERTMPCTTDPSLMPEFAISEHHQTRLFNPETMSVWCTDKQAWRSFKTMNVTSVTVQSKVYKAEITEDPNDENELFLTFDPKMLEDLGWKEGDTLLWTDNNDGTYSIKKKETAAE